MITVGTTQESPAAGTVLVTSPIVNTPRVYRVRVTVSADAAFWATFTHRTSDGAERSHIFLPVPGMLLGPVDLCEMYFHYGDYGEVAVRGGVVQVSGTVQATIELL